jgi:hypothetical protein
MRRSLPFLTHSPSRLAAMEAPTPAKIAPITACPIRIAAAGSVTPIHR